jgi:O-antigen/teichoic acid export membrane protein
MGTFTRNAFLTLLTRLAVFALALIGGVITARALGPSGKGTLTLALLVPFFAERFLNLGVGIANTYLLGKKKYTLQNVLGNSLALIITITLISGPFYLLLAPVLSRTFVTGVEHSLLLLVGILIPLKLLWTYLTCIFLGLQDIDRYNILLLAERGATLAFIVLLVLILELDVTGAICANILASVVVLGLGLGVLSRRTAIRPVWNPKLLKESVLFGLRGQTGNIVQVFNYRLDAFVANYFLGVSSVGIYSVAVALAEMLWHVPGASATVLFPQTAAAGEKEAKVFTPRVCRNVLLVTTILAAGLFVISKPLILFAFTDAYLPALVPLWFLLPGVIALSISKTLFGDLAGRGLVQYGTYTSSVSLIVTVICDLALIPRFGVTGAAVASSIAYGTSALLALFFYTRASGNSLVDTLIPRKSDLLLYPSYCSTAVRTFLKTQD